MLLQFGRMDWQKQKYGTYGIQLITTLVNLELSKRIRLYQVNMAGKSDYIQLIKMYETLRTKVEKRGQSLENFEANIEEKKKKTSSHFIFKPERTTEKETGSVLHHFFVRFWLKQIKVIHPGNKWDLLWGRYQISSGTSSPANENYPNRLTQTSSQFQFPAAIWLKRFHNDFWETISSLYFILRKEGICLFSVSNKK